MDRAFDQGQVNVMVRLIIASEDRHAPIFRALSLEYWNWGAAKAKHEYGLEVPVEEIIEQDVLDFAKFMPPKGRLLLAFVDDSAVGSACLKELAAEVGEVERAYVRPGFRRLGLGRALLRRLSNESIGIGYTCLRLASARYMVEAHCLYRSMGFMEIEPYETEVPREIRSHWISMEKRLSSAGKNQSLPAAR